jgi:N-methylhydantoinase B
VDGIDAIDTPFGFLRSTPTESVEQEMPLRVLRFGLAGDSFGAGEFRGGAALEIELECLELEMTLSVRGCDRFTFQPWGVAGGSAGGAGTGWINGRQISLIEVLTLKRGDRLTIRSPSGGGFGNPAVRDPARVLTDVTDGLLSVAAALRDYGVVITGGTVDEAETRAARTSRVPGTTPFAFGQRRVAHELIWPPEAQRALAAGLLAAPRGLRAALRTHVQTELAEGATAAAVTDSLQRELAGLEA